jgi:CheY-like chemotaxis protein
MKESWRQGRYALPLADLQMPEMHGYKLTAAMQREEAEGVGEHMPIVALTANAMSREDQRCREAGMADDLSKSVQLIHLKAMLDKWMRGIQAATLPAPRATLMTAPIPPKDAINL